MAGIRALVPPHTPLMACTATATRRVVEEVGSILEMVDYVTVSLSPNRPNIMYHVKERTNPDTDFAALLSTLRKKLITTPRVVVYCSTLVMCAALFSYELGSDQYFPPGAPSIGCLVCTMPIHPSTARM